MRTQYIAIISFSLCTISLSAQTPSERPLLPGEERYSDRPSITTRSDRGTSLYLETFDNGLGDWTPITIEGNVDWKWTDEGPGPTPSTYPVPPLSTTPGWAIIDDDHDGTMDVATEAFLVSPVIDLSAGPTDLMLEFDQYFQEYQNDSTFVGISTDGGNYWYEIELNKGVGRDNRPNPETKVINITDWVAGNPASVQIRFRYVSVWDYGWQVDNISIHELPPYEIALNFGFISHAHGGEEFGRIPSAQLNNEFLTGAELFNGGSMPLTDLQVTMEVRDEENSLVQSATFDHPLLASWDTVFVEQLVDIPASAEGIYTATFTVTCDEMDMDTDGTNNSHVRTFMIDENLYALDGIGVHPPGTELLSSTGTESFEGGQDELYLMNYFPLREPALVHGIQFDLHSASQAGGYVFVTILDSVDVWNDVVNQPLAESQIIDITQDHINAGTVNIAFDQAVQLGEGAYYAAVVLHSVAGASHLRIVDDRTVPQPALSAAIHIINDISYTNGNAWAIRMIMDPTVISVEEHAAPINATLLPNPTEGVFAVHTDITGDYTVQIFDQLGALVLADRYRGQATIDMGGRPAGVYSVRIVNDNAATTLRIVKR